MKKATHPVETLIDNVLRHLTSIATAVAAKCLESAFGGKSGGEGFKWEGSEHMVTVSIFISFVVITT